MNFCRLLLAFLAPAILFSSLPTPQTAFALEATLKSCSSQSFPFIFLDIGLRRDDLAVTDLVRDDFRCFENGTLQSDLFRVVPPQADRGIRVADIVFLIDGSESMLSEITRVQENVDRFVASLPASQVDFRLGLVQFGRLEDIPARIFNEGILTDDFALFQSFVNTLPFPAGRNEPAFLALRLALETFDFRPEVQKVFILITDEESEDSEDKYETLTQLLANDVTVHVATRCPSGSTESDYCGEGGVSALTGGLLLDTTGPYGQVLDSVAREPDDTYTLSYRSSDPILDGTARFVQCLISDPPRASVECIYVPGAAPQIALTADTKALNRTALAADSSPAISAIVVDSIDPPVNAVHLFYRTTGSAEGYGARPMVPMGNDVYEAVVPSVEFPGVDYFIQASDGEIRSYLPSADPAALPFQIAVLPNAAPEIIHDPPTRAVGNSDLPIRAIVTDSTNFVADVKLLWRQVGELAYNSVAMLNSGANVFETRIPGEEATQDIQYYIWAIDDLGVATTRGTADEPLLISVTCDRDAVCNDKDPCNGVEKCNLEIGRCVAGTPPRAAMIAMGDSTMAGFQSGVLVESLQNESFPALIARRACIQFTLPLISEEGHTIDGGSRLFNLPTGTQDLTDEDLERLGDRTNPGSQPFNLVVPGAKLKHLRKKRQSRARPLFELVLTGPLFNSRPTRTHGLRKGTQLSQAIQLNPTLVLLWIGNDDVLSAALDSDTRKLTAAKRFKKEFRRLVKKLKAGTTADIVVANIPDVTTVPHMLPVGEKVGKLPFKVFATCPCPIAPNRCDITAHLEESVIPRYVHRKGTQHPSGSLVPLVNLEKRVAAGGLCSSPFFGNEDTFGRSEVLAPNEIAAIQGRIRAFNTVIAKAAARTGLVLVDVHRLMADLEDTSFTGGFFSLDGIHPSSEGHRRLANAFIEAINAEIAARGEFGGLSEPISPLP